MFTIVGTFWWFKGVAFGIDGPINDHWGLKWRSVCLHPVVRLPYSELMAVVSCRIGTYIMSNYRISMSSSTSSLSRCQCFVSVSCIGLPLYMYFPILASLTKIYIYSI